MAIELTKIEVTKDTEKVTAFEFNASLVAPKPIEQLIQVNFSGTGLNAGQVGKFRLPSDINTDLLVKSFHLDVDNDNNDDITSAQYHVGKVISFNGRDRLLAMSLATGEELNKRRHRNLRLRELAFDIIPLAQLIIGRNGELLVINMTAQSMFGLNLNDIGRPFQDLEISYRPLELRSLIEQVNREKRQINRSDVVYHLSDGENRYVDIEIIPLIETNNQILGTSIVITDVSRYHSLQQELQHANQEMETANEELQSSNEEMETTNEELQSTNEELETTNEELQSTNEELETMNEELQSTNEELQTINDELRLRSIELDRTNAFLNSILASVKAGVVVVDRQFKILSWNEEAENLWGVRSEETKGQSFFGLDIGLPLEQLQEPLRFCLAGENIRQEMIISAINRRGQTIDCRLSFNPLLDDRQGIMGVIILMEEVRAEVGF